MVYMIVSAFVVSFLLTPVLIHICKKHNLYDEVDNRKIHTGNIPRMGGVAVFISFFTFVIAYLAIYNPEGRFKYVFIFVGAAIIFLLGTLDDFLNLSARFKFLIQMVAALFAAMSPCYLSYIFGLQIPVLLSRFLTFFWVLLLVNAYNMIDGLDLLCGGISFTTLITIGGIQIINGNHYIGVMCFILCAAIAGFLPWNFPPAKIFLGDSGSLTLGYTIALFPLVPSNNTSFEYNKFLICLLLASIPTIDVLAAIIRRGREKRSFFSPDRAHLHHKLVNIGFTKNASSLFLNFLQLLICASCFASIFHDLTYCITILTFSYSFVYLFFVVIHYVNRAINKREKGRLAENPQEEH